MNKQLLPTAAVLALVSGAASANLVTTTVYLTNSIYTAKQSNPEPLGTTGVQDDGHGNTIAAAHGPIADTGGIGGPYSVTVVHPGTLTISVTDAGQVGDVYQVFLSASAGGAPVTVGYTSEAPVALGVAADPPAFSAGSWSEAATAGVYKFDVADVIMQYIGSPAPFGIYHTYTGPNNNPTTSARCVEGCTHSGNVPSNFSPSPNYAPFFLSVKDSYQTNTTPAVPEPASLSIIGSGLIAAGLLRRRRRAKQQ
jgi:hypothetical protein